MLVSGFQMTFTAQQVPCYKKKKICNWADYRVPNSNQDFDIGAGEFSVSEKYWDKGWLDIALKNQVPNHAIKKNKVKGKTKEWWE